MSITKFKLLPVALLLTFCATAAYADKTVAPASNMENDDALNKERDGNPSVDSLLTVISAYEASLKQTREEAAANKHTGLPSLSVEHFHKHLIPFSDDPHVRRVRLTEVKQAA